MREILFRGKLSVNNGALHKKDWVYGDYVRLHDGKDITKHVIYGFGEIAFRTLGQFTGLIDKNGKKIFEGDIIKTYHGIAKVVYSQQFALFGYIMLEKDNHERDFDYRFTEISIEEGIEVIGNIYDNPELLEG